MKKAYILAVFSMSLSILPNFTYAFGPLSLSQNSVNLNIGQSVTVTISSPQNEIANVTTMSNTQVASVGINNNLATIFAINTGSSQVTFCTFDNSCASLSVNVNNFNNNNNNNFNNFGQISFSQSNVNLNQGQSTSVTVFNSTSGSLFVSSNSNPNSVSATLSGNTLNLSGLNSGSSTIAICGNNAQCANLFVSVNGTVNQISLSQSNLTLNSGQTASVSVFNSLNQQAYIASNTNPSVASTNISNNFITVTAQNSGSTTVMICVSSSVCTNLNITVNGNQSVISFSPSSVSLSQNQTVTVNILNSSSNFSSTYFISSNSNPSVVSASISANLLYVTGLNTGSSSMTICQSGSSCGTLFVSVNGNFNNGLIFNTTSLPTPVVNQYYTTQLSVRGGNPPYSYSLISGSLPLGLFINSVGQIYGTPTTNATSSFTVQATDNFSRTATQFFSLTPQGNGNVLGTLTYNNGTLVNDNGTIYITYKNTKSAFANLPAFQGLGYSLSSVINGSTASLVNSGFIIGSSNIAHPWGSWVRSGQTIYFVSDQGLIPIPSFDVFLNNGGQSQLVVNANGFDFGKPILSPMVLNDSRLR
jgi:hypothetical protein